MILTREVEVRVNNKNINHFRENGLIVNYGEILNISVDFVPKYSKYRISAKCDICESINEISMQKYSQNKERGGIYTCKSCNNLTLRKSMIERYGFDNASKVPEISEKRKATCLEKYGSEFVINSEYSKEKTKKTTFERYGVDHPMKSSEFKFKGVKKSNNTKIKRGLIICEEELTNWHLYRKKVRRLTERNRKVLFENWNGIDFYDGELIIDNFIYRHTDTRFPTIDHKISILYGFQNNLEPEIIAGIDNLCITKKSNNSSKSFLTEKDFIAKKNPLN